MKIVVVWVQYNLPWISIPTWRDFICLIASFTSDNQTFTSLFKVRRHVIGCINHVIVIGCCLWGYPTTDNIFNLFKNGVCSGNWCHASPISEQKASMLPTTPQALTIYCRVSACGTALNGPFLDYSNSWLCIVKPDLLSLPASDRKSPRVLCMIMDSIC